MKKKYFYFSYIDTETKQFLGKIGKSRPGSMYPMTAEMKSAIGESCKEIENLPDFSSWPATMSGEEQEEYNKELVDF